ncbi:MAG: aminotransferase class I/II-fold pyridoxal phosphate-dependent enzyme [Anaerolineaceae bacterium]
MNARMEGPVGAKTMIDGRLFDYFSGTGYLGLQSHPEVIAAARDALQQYGVSTAASRGGYGEHPVYDQFEKQACAFLDCEKVLYFASGYLGASILTQREGRSGDHIFIDDAAHYSLWDAVQSFNKITSPFHHCDPDHLRRIIREELTRGERPLVLTDGIFPISGEIAPLPDYLEIVQEHHGVIIVDDAHALGVLGEHGRGTVDEFEIQSEDCLTSASLAKALGGFGGITWGRANWIDNLEQGSSFCLGASPPPLVVTAASTAGLRLAKENPAWRETLWQNVTRAREGLRGMGIDVEMTRSPILCIPAGRGLDLVGIKNGLYKEGIAVSLVRGYTSTPDGGALRIAIFSTHTTEQIDRLLITLNRLF